MSVIDEVIEELDTERDRIWLECPQEVLDMSRGIIPRRTGSHGQYFSTLVFAEGEARTLSDEVLWGILEASQKHRLDLGTVVVLVDQIVSYKAAFFDFVGLPHASKLIYRYVEAAKAAETYDDFVRVTEAAITYVNRLHMWIDANFPWGLGNAFPRPDAVAGA